MEQHQNQDSTNISRRKFVKTAAVASVMPMILPSGLPGKNPSNDRIQLAAIGCGSRATQVILQNVSARDDVRIIATVDPYRERRESFAVQLNKIYGDDVCSPYEHFMEVLEMKEIDGIVVCTPDHWHVPIAYHAAMAKKDMYVEKPMGVAMKWAWKLREAVKMNEVVFQYGTQQRSAAQFRKACELVRNGYIGEIEKVDVWCPDMTEDQQAMNNNPPYGLADPAPVPGGFNYDLWLGPAPNKAYTIDRCTNIGAYHIYDYALGFIAGWGAHPLDIAQWGLDMDGSGPVSYEGYGRIPPEGSLWDSLESWDVQCSYANGIKMRFTDFRTARPIRNTYPDVQSTHGTLFTGSEGWIAVDRTDMYSHSNNKLRDIQFRETDLRFYNSDHPDSGQGQVNNFIDCMRSRKETVSTVEAAIRSDIISHLSDICIRTGSRIEWDPVREKIINGNQEAISMLDRPMRDPYIL